MDKIFIGYVVAIHNKKNRMTCQTFLTFSSGQSVSSQYVLIPYTVHLFLLVACILSHIIEYKKDAKDDPPHVKPVAISVIRRVFDLAATDDFPHAQCLADMIGLVFFFLLGPESSAKASFHRIYPLMGSISQEPILYAVN